MPQKAEDGSKEPVSPHTGFQMQAFRNGTQQFFQLKKTQTLAYCACVLFSAAKKKNGTIVQPTIYHSSIHCRSTTWHTWQLEDTPSHYTEDCD